MKAKVNKALKALGPTCWRFMPVQSGYGAPALDYLFCYMGRFFAIETKAPGKFLTPLQESTKAAIEAAGGQVFVVWDDDTLAIVSRVLLAMEFTNAKGQPHDIGQRCLAAARGDFTGSFVAERQAEAEGIDPEHVRAGYASQALDIAASGDHGASRKTPRRQPK